MKYSRRDFMRLSGIVGSSLLLSSKLEVVHAAPKRATTLNTVKKIGIIGLDTSHSEVFTRLINQGEVVSDYKVVAAYPHGSADIPSAIEMKPRIIEAVRSLGVKLVDSIDDLLKEVDYVLLESNDGRPHLEQALKVMKARKPMFIDKPIAHNYADALRIFEASKKYKSPIFSSSALRYEQHIVEAKEGKFGAVLGADVYTPASFDPHHLDFAWYGIHGVEMLYTLMGVGCEKVVRTHAPDFDVVTGYWKDGRIGSVRGIRKGAAGIAGTAYCQNAIVSVGPFVTYVPLVEEILKFFNTGVAPVAEMETLEIFRFMEAADASKKTNLFVNI